MDGHTAVGYGGIEPNHPLYKGRRYDSDLECNVAKRLDELGIAYTPQANINDDKYPFGHYTADFYLPQQGCYIEVTPVWDERHETCCRVTHESGRNIVVIDGQGYRCDWEGKRLDGPNFLNPHKKGAADSESLYEQGIRRKADELDAESIAPSGREDAGGTWMTMREFAEAIGADFLKFTNEGSIYRKGYTQAQHQLIGYIEKAFRLYRSAEYERNCTEYARDNMAKALDAIRVLSQDGVLVKLCNGDDYKLVCQKHISDNKLCKAVYQPKSGVIARHRDEGISGLDDLLKFLNGMPPSDIVAQRKAGDGR